MTTVPWTLTEFPDVESALMFALVPQFPDYRFVTSMPAADQTKIVAKIKRISGTNRNIWVDRPVVDIDVYGPIANPMDVSIAARSIQTALMSLMGTIVQNGVIQSVIVTTGPKELPEANPNLVRYSATYEVLIHP